MLAAVVSVTVALRLSTMGYSMGYSMGYPSSASSGVSSSSAIRARSSASFGPRIGRRTGCRSVQLQMCIGKVRKPLPVDDSGVRRDSDTSWQTVTNPAVVPVHRDRFTSRPQLLSFDAFDTLIQPSQSVGRWYREALNDVCDMRIRLPRPALFADAFKVAYKNMSVTKHSLLYSLASVEVTDSVIHVERREPRPKWLLFLLVSYFIDVANYFK